jgi:hypothetical protein
MFKAIIVVALLTSAIATGQDDEAELDLEAEAESDDRLLRARDALAETILNSASLTFDNADDNYGWNTLHAQYTGDDWAWPVYAFALQWRIDQICREGVCDHQWRALMNRAPAAPDADPTAANFRPRWRGMYTTGALELLMEQHPDAEIDELISLLPIEQVETNSDSCDGLIDHLGTFSEVIWLNDETITRLQLPDPDTDQIIFSLHADRMSIDFSSFRGSISSQHLVPETGNVAGWADEFVRLVEPCWQPRV